ncbi:DUF4349 domain-containing protein [Thermoanaerobacterium sp. RBIITD]|uniref:DUF4349 domain-containing protein n=1 Tax=Thermoanaerobacterium sp. RBIITD TaxID=1550240 RepID=UPI000BB7CAAE|nr:DUF4349 domain-containing protein [Thermoanaerobacterium sp. RBIITD]SNX55124.1 Putative zinc-finger [Thermoanaerobacterium sp. RBIITD]
MYCNEVKELINQYVDDELDEKNRRDVKEHINTCEDCKKDYNIISSIKEILSEMPPVTLPEDFSAKLHENLVKTESRLNVKRKLQKFKGKFGFDNMKWLKTATVIISVLFILTFAYKLFGNVIKNNDRISTHSLDQSVNKGLATGESKSSQSAKSDINRGFNPSYERKITKDATISIETDNGEKCFNKILSLADQYKGYVENSSESDTSDNKKIINIILKIPANDFENVIANIKALGSVKAIRVGSNDITEQYYDIESRIKNLEIQEQRLQEIMKKANTVSEILQVESELNNVRTQIDSYKTQIKVWDNMTSMSTINLTFVTFKAVDNKSFTIGKGFLNDLIQALITSIDTFFKVIKDIFIIIIYILPYGLIGYLLYRGYKLFKK